MHIGSVIGLRPEFEERYVILHKHPFPEVLRRIRKSNIRNYSIFLHSGLLFSHYEYIGRDYRGDMKRIAADPTTREWWKLTGPMQKPIPGRKRGEWWARLEMVYRSSRVRGDREDLRKACYRATYRRNPGAQLQRILQQVIALMDGNAIRNIHVFNGFSCVFLYFECKQKDLPKVSAMLNSSHRNSGRRGTTRKVLTSPWQEMKMVFYTA